MRTKNFSSLIFAFLLCITTAKSQNLVVKKNRDSEIIDTLIRIQREEVYEFGNECGYINQHGDTIYKIGTFNYCPIDTAVNFVIVAKSNAKTQKLIAIDLEGKMLFEVYIFDNGPDYISNGLFRILKKDKIGYANQKGEVVIKPQFECALPFKNGRAKVTFKCNLEKNNLSEHSEMTSKSWFYIDKDGNKILE